MKKISLFVTLIAILFASEVIAHGAPRHKMIATIMIDAPADKVWAVINNYGDMSWHPDIDSSQSDKGNEVGSVRTLTFKNGGTIVDDLDKYKAGKMSYKYKLVSISSVGTVHHGEEDLDIPFLPISISGSMGILSVKDKGGKALVKWQAGYYRSDERNDPPEELGEDVAKAGIRDFLSKGLMGLAQTFDANVSVTDVGIVLDKVTLN